MPDELYLIDGNSLAYRAFFALPESIATSKGQPTNAIFGLASMLVKLLTEHGVKPTIVAWDAGMSGRKEVYGEYKAQRTSRPDLLKEQWPHFEPLVDAFGYRNISVEGYEADDVIATIAERARAEGIPVVIVTGDRDTFQLIDPDSRVKVMATARGITDTKLYDHQAVIDRYGIPPELIPDFYGLKGDTSDNIPGVPGIGDKTAAQLLQQFGSLEDVLAHIDEVSGAKRKENLTNHAEDARVSKRLATVQRDVPVDLDPAAGGRARARPLAAARGLPRVRAARPAAPPGGGPRRRGAAAPTAAETAATLRVRVRRGRASDVARLGDGKAPRRDRGPGARGGRGRAVRARGVLALRRGLRRARSSPASSPARASSSSALGERPVIAHDAKALGVVPATLAHDTLLGAYLLDPARRAFPFAELCDERGLAADVEDPAAADAVLAAGARRAPARSSSPSAGRSGCWTRSSCRWSPCCARWRSRACASNCDRLAVIGERVARGDRRARARDLGPRRARSS